MNRMMSQISKEILAEKEQVRLLEDAVKQELQLQLEEACKNDKSHTARFSQ